MKPTLLLLTALAISPALPAADTAIKLEKNDKTSTVNISTADGKPILTYQMQPGDVPEGTSPIFKHGAHIHPVYSPSGKLVTGNHPPDHPHQRGIWFAWTKTEFGDAHPDFWNQGKTETKEKSKDKPKEKAPEGAKVAPKEGADKLLAEIRFDKLVKTWSDDKAAGFTSEHRFLDLSTAAERDVLRETWDVTASQQKLGDRLANVIDLVSTQTCAGDIPLKLPQYHYGGLGIRGNALWDKPEDVTMITSEGLDRIKGDASKAKWVQFGGQVDGGPTGIVTLIHPSNFRFPQPLRLNPKNPQICVVPSVDGDWSIEPGKPYVSKYRLLIVDGPADPAWINAQWEAYAKSK